MKTKSLLLAVAGIFALSSLALAGSQFVNNSPSVGIHKVAAKDNSQRLDDKELGIGKYNEHAMNDSQPLNDQELGIGKYNDRA